MLGFARTDNEALASRLRDPQRAVAAFRQLLRRDTDAPAAVRAGLRAAALTHGRLLRRPC